MFCFISSPSLSGKLLFLAALLLLFLSVTGENNPYENDPYAAVHKETEFATSALKASAPGESSISRILISGYEELVKALTFVDESLHTQLAGLFISEENPFFGIAINNEVFENNRKIKT